MIFAHHRSEARALDALIAPLKIVLEKKGIRGRSAGVFCLFSGEDQEIMADQILSTCYFTKTELLKIGERFCDVCRKERITLCTLLNRSPYRETLSNPGLSQKQKASQILKALEATVYSSLSRMEALWKEGLESLARPRDIWIPLVRALECGNFEDALECRAERRGEAFEWVATNKVALKQLLHRSSSIDG